MPRLTGFTPPPIPFTAAQVEVGHEYLRVAADRGVVTRLIRGVYVAADAVPGDPLQRYLQLALAHQVRTPDLVASHETAVAALGMPTLESVRPDMTPRFTRPPRPSLRPGGKPWVTLRPLHPVDVVPASGAGLTDLRITAAPRTAVDIAGELALPEALIALDWICRRCALERTGRRLRGALPETLLQASRQPLFATMERSGIRPRARRTAIGEWVALADPRRESPAESLSFGYIHLSALPDPHCQVAVETDQGVKYADFGWPQSAVVGEVDGMIKYGSPHGRMGGYEPGAGEEAGFSLVREKLRQEAMQRSGWGVVRWTAVEIRDRPGVVLARIAAALGGRGWSAG